MIRNLLINIQNLSIDIALGAIAMSWLFAQAHHVQMPIIIYLLLGLSVWIVYTLDHLLDAKKIKTQAQTSRHRFHQKHFDILFKTETAVLILALLLAYMYVPPKTWLWGASVILFTVTHFTLVHLFGTTRSKWVLKEVGVAWCYTTGIAVCPLSLLNEIQPIHILSVIFLFIIAFFNLILFSFFDFQNDLKHGQTSIAINYGKRATAHILNCLFTLSLVLGFMLLIQKGQSSEFYLLNGYLLFISCFYFLMLRASRHFRQTSLYRILGDGVFIVPFIFIVFA